MANGGLATTHEKISATHGRESRVTPEPEDRADLCLFCNEGFTELEWLNRHSPEQDKYRDCHERCCTECGVG